MNRSFKSFRIRGRGGNDGGNGADPCHRRNRRWRPRSPACCGPCGRCAARPRRADRQHPRCTGVDHPLGNTGHRRRLGPGRRAVGDRSCRDRPRQRRCRRGHASRGDGRQRTAEQHHLRSRTHDGVVAGPGAQHPSGARRADRRSMGALAVGGRRARRQDTVGHRPRSHRQARCRSRQGLRYARRRLRPLRVGRPSDRWVSSCCRSTRPWPKPTS